jgi:Putative transmembrane protein (PGPGW)
LPLQQSNDELLQSLPFHCFQGAALQPIDLPAGAMLETIFSQQTIQSLLTWLAGLSLATFLLSLLLIPFIVNRLSADCFLLLNQPKASKTQLTAAALCFLVLRNLFGMFLLLAGISMLFLPGQGILTMLLGILLLSFPGKQRFIIYLINFPGVRQGLDWLRKKGGKQSFAWPEA